ncbi:MAG: carbon storage regulator [Halorhodospira sp.]
MLLDEQVVLEVIAVRGQQVRLGIQAPREVAIQREELFESGQLREVSYSES